MQKSAHSGEALREYLGDMTITGVAARPGVIRVALSRILNDSNGIAADMALRFDDALGVGVEIWLGMQKQHELWITGKKKRPKMGWMPKRAAA